MDNTSITTEAAQMAQEFEASVKAMIDSDFLAIGHERVSTKEIRSLIRQAIEGDGQSMAEVEKMHGANARDDGRNPVEDEIHAMLKDHHQGGHGLFGEVG